MRRGAAIDADDERGAAIREPAQRRRVGAVAFRRSVGDVGMDHEAQPPQQLRHQCRRAGPVHVVVAEDADGFALAHGARHPGRRHVHVDEGRGVGQQGAQRRREVVRGLLDPDAAQRQQAADDLRHVEALGDAEAQLRCGFGAIDPPQPSTAAEAALHPQNRVRRLRLRLRPGGEGAQRPRPGTSVCPSRALTRGTSVRPSRALTRGTSVRPSRALTRGTSVRPSRALTRGTNA